MMMIRLSSLAATTTILSGCAAAFMAPLPQSTSKTVAFSYLDSLNGGSKPMPSFEQAIKVAPPPAATRPTPPPPVVGTSVTYAPLSYFDMSKLTGKGPRQTFDWGAPADASRKLCDDGVFRAGAWSCTVGGWPSMTPKAVTEIFLVAAGFGSLDDADGVRHYFGPGDTVIIPKGHTGRWDVYEQIHKVWAVNAHTNIEETSSPIRVQVHHYHTSTTDLYPVGGMDPLLGPTTSENPATEKVMYSVGPTQVGVWASEKGTSIPVEAGSRAWIHVLEGTVCVTKSADDSDGAGQSTSRCVAGDTVVVPLGWSGIVDVLESTKVLYVTAA